jgi:hypothetical protein
MSSTGGERLHQWKSDPQRFACGSAAGVESKTSYRCAGRPGPRQVLSATAAGRAWDLVRSGAANAFEALIRNADQEAVVATPIASITVRTRLVWGFFCQAVVLGLLSVLCSERERPFFVPSPAIRFPERAEGVKGPKR